MTVLPRLSGSPDNRASLARLGKPVALTNAAVFRPRAPDVPPMLPVRQPLGGFRTGSVPSPPRRPPSPLPPAPILQPHLHHPG